VYTTVEREVCVVRLSKKRVEKLSEKCALRGWARRVRSNALHGKVRLVHKPGDDVRVLQVEIVMRTVDVGRDHRRVHPA
jgi:hypothetical protein